MLFNFGQIGRLWTSLPFNVTCKLHLIQPTIIFFLISWNLQYDSENKGLQILGQKLYYQLFPFNFLYLSEWDKNGKKCCNFFPLEWDNSDFSIVQKFLGIFALLWLLFWILDPHEDKRNPLDSCHSIYMPKVHPHYPAVNQALLFDLSWKQSQTLEVEFEMNFKPVQSWLPYLGKLAIFSPNNNVIEINT